MSSSDDRLTDTEPAGKVMTELRRSAATFTLLRRASAFWLHYVTFDWTRILDVDLRSTDDTRNVGVIALSVFHAYMDGRYLSKMELLRELGTQHNATGQKYLDLLIAKRWLELRPSSIDRRRIDVAPTMALLSAIETVLIHEVHFLTPLSEQPDEVFLYPQAHPYILAEAQTKLAQAAAVLAHDQTAMPAAINQAYALLVLGSGKNVDDLIGSLAKRDPHSPEIARLVRLLRQKRDGHPALPSHTSDSGARPSQAEPPLILAAKAYTSPQQPSTTPDSPKKKRR